MKKTLMVVMAAIVVVLGPSVARAATCTWSGAGDGTSWSDAANWGGTAPAAGRTIIIR